MLKPIDVHIQLESIHCFEKENGIGNADPYLWVIFLKIDGDSTFVDERFVIRGAVTEVCGHASGRGNLGLKNVRAGDDIAIPAQYGYRATLKPILQMRPEAELIDLGGIIGCAVVLLEADDTLYSTAGAAYRTLLVDIKNSLNDIISIRALNVQPPSHQELDEIKKKIALTIADAIERNLENNMDDKIGVEIFEYSHEDLLNGSDDPIIFSKRWKNKGDWKITGSVSICSRKRI